MAFVDGFVAAVPNANRTAFAARARELSAMFLDYGAVEVVDAWGSDVPAGKLTSFPLAVKCEPDESVVLGWVVWPSRAARDAGWQKAESDPRMAGEPGDLYDGRRMIFGGFDVIHSTKKET